MNPLTKQVGVSANRDSQTSQKQGDHWFETLKVHSMSAFKIELLRLSLMFEVTYASKHHRQTIFVRRRNDFIVSH